MTDTESPTGSWPTRAGDSIVLSRPVDTFVGSPPPAPAPDRPFGAGMLLGTAAVLLALAGAAIAYLLVHRGPNGPVTTVLVRSTAPHTRHASSAAKPAVHRPAPTPTTPTQPVTTTAAATAAPTVATVPNVSGQKEAGAVQALSSAGILASLFFVPAADPLGAVLGQAKPEGTTVPYHSRVQINISSGPGDKPKEQVPNVIGRTLQDALASINGAHLRLLYLRFPVTSRSQAGKVVQQTPLAGGHAPRNAQVVVFLGAFSS